MNFKRHKPKKQRDGFLSINECSISGAIVPEVAYCLAATSGRHTGTDWSRTYVSYYEAVRRLIPEECEALQGFPKDWTNVKVNGSDIDTDRYHALGNAVSVPVVNWIAKKIKTNLTNQNQIKRKKKFIEIVQEHQDFQHKSLRSLKLSELHLSTYANGKYLKWQTGGLVIGDDCWDISAPEAPSKPLSKNLIDIISKEQIAEKYFISANAAEGILRRVNSQNRTLFEPMNNALKRMVEAMN